MADVQRMCKEADIKSSVLENITVQVTRLQSQLQQQQAHEDELRAEHQRQIQELQTKLAVSAEQLQKLETERWEVLEAMSTMAAGSMQLDREHREVERARLQLETLQRELEAREALSRASVQVPLLERLSLEDVASLAGQYGELSTCVDRVEAVLRRRLLTVAGHDPAAAGVRGSRSSAGSGAGGRDGKVDLSHDPALQYLDGLRQQLLQANSYLARSASVDASVVEAAPVARHLQQQVSALSKVLLLVASDAEADVNKMSQQQARVNEVASRLGDLLQENAELAAKLAAAPQVAQELEEQRKENEVLQQRFRATKKKLRQHFEVLASHNKELRAQLEEHNAKRADQHQGASRMAEKVSELEARLAEAQAHLQAQQQHTAALAADLQRERENAGQLAAQTESVRAAAQQAGACIQDLEAQVAEEQRARLAAAESHEAQLAALRGQVQSQLQAVVDAYSEELGQLHAQLVRLDAQQHGAPDLAALPTSSSQSGTAAYDRGAAGRADAWKSAYEEAQALASTLTGQLQEANGEIARLQAELRAAASASATAGRSPSRPASGDSSLQLWHAVASPPPPLQARAAMAASPPKTHDAAGSFLVTLVDQQQPVATFSPQRQQQMAQQQPLAGRGEQQQKGLPRLHSVDRTARPASPLPPASEAPSPPRAAVLAPPPPTPSHSTVPAQAPSDTLMAQMAVLQQQLAVLLQHNVALSQQVMELQRQPQPAPGASSNSTAYGDVPAQQAQPRSLASNRPAPAAASAPEERQRQQQQLRPDPAASAKQRGAQLQPPPGYTDSSEANSGSCSEQLPQQAPHAKRQQHTQQQLAAQPKRLSWKDAAEAYVGGGNSHQESESGWSHSHGSQDGSQSAFEPWAHGFGVLPADLAGRSPSRQRPVPSAGGAPRMAGNHGGSGGLVGEVSEQLISTRPFFPLGIETSGQLQPGPAEGVGMQPMYVHATREHAAAAWPVAGGRPKGDGARLARGATAPGAGSERQLYGTGEAELSQHAGRGPVQYQQQPSQQQQLYDRQVHGDGSRRRQQHQEQQQATSDGPPVPAEVLNRIARYAGDEGFARPSTAVPSALRLDRADSGPPVPEDVLQYVAQYTGDEGQERPSTASPSVLRASQREAPVPPEVIHYMAQYTGDEGGARPSTATPSVLNASNRQLSAEVAVPEFVVHMAAQFQTGGEGITRPITAPSSDIRRSRQVSIELGVGPLSPGRGPTAGLSPGRAASMPLSPAHGATAAALGARSASTAAALPGAFSRSGRLGLMGEDYDDEEEEEAGGEGSSFAGEGGLYSDEREGAYAVGLEAGSFGRQRHGIAASEDSSTGMSPSLAPSIAGSFVGQQGDAGRGSLRGGESDDGMAPEGDWVYPQHQQHGRLRPQGLSGSQGRGSDGGTSGGSLWADNGPAAGGISTSGSSAARSNGQAGGEEQQVEAGGAGGMGPQAGGEGSLRAPQAQRLQSATSRAMAVLLARAVGHDLSQEGMGSYEVGSVDGDPQGMVQGLGDDVTTGSVGGDWEGGSVASF